MSLPEAPEFQDPNAAEGLTRRSALRVFVVAAIAAPLLAACGSGGFRPMYGSGVLGGGALDEKLAMVQVAPIPGRVGQRIRNELIFETTGGGQALPPAYRLEVVLRESVTATLVQITGNAQGTVYNLDANFRLIKVADKSVVLQGASTSRAPFERFTSIFANVRARKDAEDRAARTIGTELKSRLAAFLATA